MTTWNKPQYDDDGNVVLTDFDILLGRGRTSFNHKGNRRFRKFIVCNVQRYSISTNRFSKSLVVSEVLKGIKLAGGRFLREGTDGKYFEVADKVAKEKIGHALRDVLFMKEPNDGITKKKRRNTPSKLTKETPVVPEPSSPPAVKATLGAPPASVTPDRQTEKLDISHPKKSMEAPLLSGNQSSLLSVVAQYDEGLPSSPSLVDSENDEDVQSILQRAQDNFSVLPREMEYWERPCMMNDLIGMTSPDDPPPDGLTAADWDLGLSDLIPAHKNT
mmetsp:Transcript_33094/g.46985  ORF Transcript_33094/g.46985 Transcript_33094/m.46985 type:complete len:274 (-) Transcript_33094:90-911(-)